MNVHPMRRIGDLKRNRRLRKGMFVLPSLFTAGNIAAGYYALAQIVQGASSGEYWHLDYCARAIGFAVLFDGLDGRIARMTNTTSDFGRQLDSLADVIAFGVAPALLAYVWGVREMSLPWDGDLRAKLVLLGMVITFVFLAAGASRLARFNIQNDPKPSNPGRPGRKYFVGMPIPAGAGVIAAVVHLSGGAPLLRWWLTVVWMLLVMLVSFLMVSTWRFYSFKDLDLRRQQPWRSFVLVAVPIVLIVLFSRYTLFVVAMTYMLSGVIARVSYSMRRPKARQAAAMKPDESQITESDLN